MQTSVLHRPYRTVFLIIIAGMVDPEFGDSIIDVNHRLQLLLVVATAC